MSKDESFKAAIITIFILIMDHMTHIDEPTVNYFQTAVPLSIKERFSNFRFIVLLSWPATLQFCLILMALVSVAFSHSRQVF